jgi:hypothetical protein
MREAEERAVAANPGLCRDCRHARRITSDRGSVFLLCDLHRVDSNFPKYPRLPVLSCRGYQRKPQAPSESA